MTPRENILQELNELRSSLATINTRNMYTVPVGYFDGLAALVLNRIKALEAATASEELGYLSPMLSNISKEMPYTIPAGYFEGLETNNYQLAKGETENSPSLLSGIKKEMPYSVPQGYFDGLAEKAIQSIRESNNYETAKEELETLSPLLSGLKKEMPYFVPQGYFERLASSTSKEENTPAIKVVSITSHTWFRYAAAAVVVGIITMTGFLLIGKGEKEPGVKALAKITHDVKKMDETQKDNLMDFIDAGMSGQETAQTSPDNKSEVKDLLKGISEEELKDFQEQTEDVQDVLMTN